MALSACHYLGPCRGIQFSIACQADLVPGNHHHQSIVYMSHVFHAYHTCHAASFADVNGIPDVMPVLLSD
jgi:hypothetical protein